MATRLKHRTVVFIGGGFTAALDARQLTAKGVDVVVLERGIDRTNNAATSLTMPISVAARSKPPCGVCAILRREVFV
jgi:choline dehydrogenase-like flavoprotein